MEWSFSGEQTFDNFKPGEVRQTNIFVEEITIFELIQATSCLYLNIKEADPMACRGGTRPLFQVASYPI
jgi:hypothetical protein